MSAMVIPIHVHVVDTPPDGRAGTFIRPHALVRVKVNTDTVQWVCAGPFDSFTVKFKPNNPPLPTSPFPGITAITSTAGPTPALTPTVPGNFHYTVNVTVSGITWSIDGCPEIGVDL
jgi:hypothetical protein